MPLGDKINVALREQNCQKIGSERVKVLQEWTQFWNMLLDFIF